MHKIVRKSISILSLKPSHWITNIWWTLHSSMPAVLRAVAQVADANDDMASSFQLFSPRDADFMVTNLLCIKSKNIRLISINLTSSTCSLVKVSEALDQISSRSQQDSSADVTASQWEWFCTGIICQFQSRSPIHFPNLNSNKILSESLFSPTNYKICTSFKRAGANVTFLSWMPHFVFDSACMMFNLVKSNVLRWMFCYLVLAGKNASAIEQLTDQFVTNKQLIESIRY